MEKGLLMIMLQVMFNTIYINFYAQSCFFFLKTYKPIREREEEKEYTTSEEKETAIAHNTKRLVCTHNKHENIAPWIKQAFNLGGKG